MCGGRSSILHYGPLIETNYLYAPTPNGQKPECVAKQKQYPLATVLKSYIQHPECTHCFLRSPYDRYGSSSKHTWSSTVIRGITQPRTVLHDLYVYTKLVPHSTARSTRVLAAYFIVEWSYF